MQITAGHLRGRKVPVPHVHGLRPTPAKVRQALFNILGDIEDWHVLDLFSGSGIMSLEAMSRHAESAMSIETNHHAIHHMGMLKQLFDLQGWRICAGTLPHALISCRDTSYDLVFADPPYNKGIAVCIPAWLDQQHIQCHHLVIEESSHAQLHWPDNWLVEQTRRYGDSSLYFLSRIREPNLLTEAQ